jgi:hypothetical protein
MEQRFHFLIFTFICIHTFQSVLPVNEMRSVHVRRSLGDTKGISSALKKNDETGHTLQSQGASQKDESAP